MESVIFWFLHAYYTVLGVQNIAHTEIYSIVRKLASNRY